jgi:hypothetical protein
VEQKTVKTMIKMEITTMEIKITIISIIIISTIILYFTVNPLINFTLSQITLEIN